MFPDVWLYTVIKSVKYDGGYYAPSYTYVLAI